MSSKSRPDFITISTGLGHDGAFLWLPAIRYFRETHARAGRISYRRGAREGSFGAGLAFIALDRRWQESWHAAHHRYIEEFRRMSFALQARRCRLVIVEIVGADAKHHAMKSSELETSRKMIDIDFS